MRHLNRYIFSTTLLLTALTSQAVQLGSAKGAAVFGRLLDLSVQVRLDTPAEEAAGCFFAEIFQADNKFDVGRVRLDLIPAVNGLDATVRIRSVTAVNEPWAKVILRSNCGSKISRQYDFLTDFSSDAPAASVLAENTPATVVATTAASVNTSEVPVSNWSVARSQAKTKTPTAKTDTQNVQVTAAPNKAKQTTPTVAATALNTTKKTTEMVSDAVGQSRLKMETFELADERQVLLKLSTALVEPTGMRTPEEIQALAQATAVWRAINAMPAATTPTTAPTTAPAVVAQAKISAVETLPVTLPALMNQKLAGKSEFSNLMVYGLITLLILTLGCIAWLWLRVRKATRAGYGWLNDSLSDEGVTDHEPTQFLHTNFHETFTQVEPEYILNDEPEPASELEAAAEAVIDHELINELAEHQNKEIPSTVSEKPVVNAFTDHFDNQRFDERVLRVKNKDRDIAYEKPIVSSVGLMDLVLADTPPKLRSVATTAPVLEDKASVAKAPKATSSKDDTKGNLIDFDVFAEPEPLHKPTRFVR